MPAKTSLPAFKRDTLHKVITHPQFLPFFAILLQYNRHLVKHTDIGFIGFKTTLYNRNCLLPFLISKQIEGQGNTDSGYNFICSPKTVAVLDEIIDYFIVKVFFQPALECRNVMLSEARTVCCVDKPSFVIFCFRVIFKSFP